MRPYILHHFYLSKLIFHSELTNFHHYLPFSPTFYPLTVSSTTFFSIFLFFLNKNISLYTNSGEASALVIIFNNSLNLHNSLKFKVKETTYIMRNTVLRIATDRSPKLPLKDHIVLITPFYFVITVPL